MADFCKACSIAVFGEDSGDLRGLSTPEGVAKGLYALAIFEGCGYIQVDVDGNCVSLNCLCAGDPGHGVAIEKLP